MAAPVDFDGIQARLRDALAKYAPPLTVTENTAEAYELYSMHPHELAGRTADRIYFAGVRRMKSFVGFYFFPVYTHPEEFADIDPGVRKLLKGKSCFNVKQLDEATLAGIEAMLARGLRLYRQEGLVPPQ